MQDLLNLILTNITTHPEEVAIVESDEEGVTVYTIKVNPEDMGRVIGKDGKVIRAIRSLAHVIAVRQGKRFRIKLADAEGSEAGGDDEDGGVSAEPAPETQVAKKEDAADLIAGAIDVPETEE